ncbi:helix-turn-helix transcriptional regulator [Actinomadura sp. NPDC047616]|uniref:helix-turn-helix domain-containing protein n=1 Tax=Actinomadura sp. NPDC047616 TaxID=3155914 RepID=UPI0033C25862
MTANGSPKDSGQTVWDQTVATNLKRLRTMRGLSTTRLSALLKDRGQSIPPTGITRIEKGQRRVSAGELASLAVVLRVSPLTLLLPWTERPEEQVGLPGIGAVTTDQLWLWADGVLPLDVSDADPQGDQQRFKLDSRPPWARDWARYLTFIEALKVGDEAGKLFDQAQGEGLTPREVLEKWQTSWRHPREERPS